MIVLGLFTKRADVLQQDLVKSRSAAEVPVNCQSDAIIITSNLVISRLHEISR